MRSRPSSLTLPDAIFGDRLDPLSEREWLVTNGLGGYAAGTLAGINTRRYHGLLVAAHPAPNARWVLVAGADLSVSLRTDALALSSQEYPDGVVHPGGFRRLTGFRLLGQRPVWRWDLEGGALEQTLWMPYGQNRTCLRFHNLLDAPVALRWRPFIALRWFHALRSGAHGVSLSRVDGDVVEFADQEGAPGLRIVAAGWTLERAADWYRAFVRRVERARGFDHLEDLFTPGEYVIHLPAGQAATLQLSDADLAPLADPDHSLEEFDQRADRVIEPAASPLEARLRLAADQFLVQRGASVGDLARPNTVIAGYPWFGDWGRDTMIALPGLCLATGRPEVAKAVLIHYARFINRGMLPNRWPDAGERPEYTSVDAALWFLSALDAYVRATDDTEILEVLATAVVDVIDWHLRGTRHGIRVDPADGLLSAGVDGLQLTWMDAKYGEWVVTPRRGKPVEVNALWCAGLAFAARALRRIGWSGADYVGQAAKARDAFARRFWNPATGCLFDVVDGPNGDDPAIRPNQIIAVALDCGLLEPGQAAHVVSVVERELLTPVGLRSLARGHPDYVAAYAGGPRQRDGGYHQGPVWSWLLGPFVDAKLAVGGSAADLDPLLHAMHRHLEEGAIGNVSEILQPEAPFQPDGAFAQAWGVGEWLRALQAIQSARHA